jgi:hypothetical protein
VGLSPYPGSRYPRVAGFVRIADGETSSSPVRMQYVHGDALDPRGTGVRLIYHLVPDRSLIWDGNGFGRTSGGSSRKSNKDFNDWAQVEWAQNYSSETFTSLSQQILSGL